MKSVKDLFKGGQVKIFKKGHVILHQGDSLTHLYYIKKGYVKLYNILETGDERILLIMGPGHAFPMTNAMYEPNYELLYFYEAMSDCELIIIEREKVIKTLKSSYAAIQVFLEYVTQLNRYVILHLEVLESKSAHDKIKKIFPQLIEKFGRTIDSTWTELKVKLTHQDIANMTGLTRETASIQIKNLEDEAMLKQHRGKLRINTKKL